MEKNTSFKPFNPVKLSRQKIYKKEGVCCGMFTDGNDHRSLCSNCGYPYGEHCGNILACPSKERMKSSKIKPVKH